MYDSPGWSKLRAIVFRPACVYSPQPPAVMKTLSLLCQSTRLLVVVGALLVSSVAHASEPRRVPPPPTPQKVVHDIGAFFHRVADGVKIASKQTWGAIRERFTADDEQKAAPRSRRSLPRGQTEENAS